jgi:hypothetical protein
MTSNKTWWLFLPLLAFGCAHSGGQGQSVAATKEGGQSSRAQSSQATKENAQATKEGGKSQLIDEGPANAGATAGAAGATANAAAPQLVPFHSSGGFTVLMPPNPQQSDRSEETAGGTVKVHVAQAAEPAGKPSYVATYTEFPPGTLTQSKPKDVLDAVQQSTARSVGGSVTASKDIQVAGLPGREFTAQTADGNMIARVLVGKERLYTLAGTYGQGPPPDSVQRFLASFNPSPNAATGGSGEVGAAPAPMSDSSALSPPGTRANTPTPRAPDRSSSSQ